MVLLYVVAFLDFTWLLSVGTHKTTISCANILSEFMK
jgi:hypothetical protein